MAEISASEVALSYVEFLGYFGIYGALGFRLVLGRLNTVGPAAPHASAIAPLRQVAERRAAAFGCFGSLLLIVELIIAAAQKSAKHPSVLHAVLHPGPKIAIQLLFGLLALLAFAAALKSVRGAWALAAIAGAGFVFRNIVSGKPTALVNPLHEAGAALWLGTLLVLVAAGLPAVLRGPMAREHRASVVAELVARFSPLALGGAALMGLTGVITAWTHLKHIAALWTTAYGLTLDIKLCVVALVAALGAWNWRRLTPRLKAEEAAAVLRRSSTAELAFAALVLLLTAVLVALPSPK